MYYKGKRVAKDYDKAAQLFQKACDGGSAAGCNNLGVMLEEGKGVAEDDAKAAQFYKKACDSDFELAYAALDKVNR